MKKLTYITIFVVLLSSSSFGFDFLKSHGLGLGETIVLSDSKASDYLLVPNSSLANKNLLLEFGLNRKYDLKDLDQLFLTSAYRYKKFSFRLGLNQFGYRNLYSEQTLKLGTAYHLNHFTFGLSASVMHLQFGGYYEDLNTIGLNSSLSYRHDKILAALAFENINSPKLDDNSEKIDPRISLFTEVLGISSFSITGRMTYEKDRDMSFGLGQMIALREKANFFWGISTEPMTFGGGILINISDGAISYAASYHPTLGMSHLVTLSYTLGKKKEKFKTEF